jgi:rhamnosyltransferase subunit B
MNFLLGPVGSAGDVHPYVAIGAALQARGHDVTIMTNPHFERLIRRLGLGFLPLGTEGQYLEVTEHPDLWNQHRGVSVVAHAVGLAAPIMYRLIEEHHSRTKTTLVAGGLAFGARIAHETLGIPLVTLHLQPSCFYSTYDSPVMHPWLAGINGWPRVVKRLVFRLTDVAADRVMAPHANRLRAELNLPPVRHITSRWWHSPVRVIGLFPDWFAPPQPDWPPQAVLTGFPLYDERGATDIPAEAQRFIETGDPPIVFTAGSGNRQGRVFFQAAVDACRLLGRRGVLLTRFLEQVPSHGLGRGVRHFAYVPLSHILPRSAALVHHGGIGTMAQGLAAGIPQLVMPMTFDQPDNARRLEGLGAGRRLAPAAFRGSAVARALDSLLGSQAVREQCRAVASRFADTDAITRTCELIEEATNQALGARR